MTNFYTVALLFLVILVIYTFVSSLEGKEQIKKRKKEYDNIDIDSDHILFNPLTGKKQELSKNSSSAKGTFKIDSNKVIDVLEKENISKPEHSKNINTKSTLFKNIIKGFDSESLSKKHNVDLLKGVEELQHWFNIVQNSTELNLGIESSGSEPQALLAIVDDINKYKNLLLTETEGHFNTYKEKYVNNNFSFEDVYVHMKVRILAYGHIYLKLRDYGENTLATLEKGYLKKLSYVDKKDIIHESISKDVRDYLNLSSESVSNNYALNWFYYIKMEVHSRLYACIEFALSNSISNVDISEWFNDFGNDKMVFKDSETECHNLLFKTQTDTYDPDWNIDTFINSVHLFFNGGETAFWKGVVDYGDTDNWMSLEDLMTDLTNLNYKIDADKLHERTMEDFSFLASINESVLQVSNKDDKFPLSKEDFKKLFNHRFHVCEKGDENELLSNIKISYFNYHIFDFCIKKKLSEFHELKCDNNFEDYFVVEQMILILDNLLLYLDDQYLDGGWYGKKSIKVRPNRNSIKILNVDETVDVGIATHYNNKPFSGILQFFDEENNLTDEVDYLEGLKNGLRFVYDKDGNKYATMYYVNDRELATVRHTIEKKQESLKNSSPAKGTQSEGNHDDWRK